MKLLHCLKSQKGTDQISWEKVMVLMFIKGGLQIPKMKFKQLLI